MAVFDILRSPDRVDLLTGGRIEPLQSEGGGWRSGDVTVAVCPEDAELAVCVVAEETALERLRLRWSADVPPGLRFLSDHWERGYGDLEWRGLAPERVMPWYFLAYDGAVTHGYGVKTGASAFCFWTVDDCGISLWLDVRNGGSGVELKGRTLVACHIVSRQGREGETPFASARALCQGLCDRPRQPAHPVYGSNNWYYAYGHSSHQEILSDTRLLMSLVDEADAPPSMVIDAGWQGSDAPSTYVACAANLWDRGNERFPDMPGLAGQMHALGARPGIWLRPLLARRDDSAALLMPVERAIEASARARILDPSHPEVLDRVAADVAQLRAWGYEVIKHDWTACDVLGRWGFQMGADLTSSGWRLADRSRTTAEIVSDLYAAIRRGAGDAVVIGCNTLSHLSAGFFELQRTGDDTSGREWERTRKMGVNTLAFRMPQHGAFYWADADCVGLTENVPWALNRQWLDLLARSGTPLFVSADPQAIGSEQADALKAAFGVASREQPAGEPLDWLTSTCPSVWRLGDEITRFDWYGSEGVNLW